MKRQNTDIGLWDEKSKSEPKIHHIILIDSSKLNPS
jgi:hypothetical protein